MSKCHGCGSLLQSKDPNGFGYTPKTDASLCMRCFKMKNYGTLLNKGVSIDNDVLLDKINKKGLFTLFLIDFLSLCQEKIDVYKSIKNPKCLVITKSDIVPRNILLPTLINNIKDIYDISEDVYITSSKYKKNLNLIKNVLSKHKTCIIAGFTNAGKSSLVNTLLDTSVTVSSHYNTTQDFIKLTKDDLTIYDAPGFISSNENFQKVRFEEVKPKTYNLLSRYYLLINSVKLNVSKDAKITIYTNYKVEKRREKSDVTCNIAVPKNSDVYVPGLGFIRFSSSAYISLTTTNYEIRPTIIGGKIWVKLE